jgi:acyl-CoA thioesterase II
MAEAKKPSAPDALTELLAILAIEPLELNLFRARSPQNTGNRVYGGQVLAQALIAAARTVPAERAVHSLHAYFLLGGDPTIPIIYEVERLRDGGSFSTRRVLAIQNGQPIYSMIASFHAPEPGFEHAAPMPDGPGPEDVLALGAFLAKADIALPDVLRAYHRRPRPFELRLIDTERYVTGGSGVAPRQRFWVRPLRPVEGDLVLHAALLAYVSDFAMIDTALIPHGKVMLDPGMQLATLDHAIWFHRPFRADDWLLYVLESPVAGSSRGFTRGTFHTRDGQLIATTAQEGLMRERTSAFVIK